MESKMNRLLAILIGFASMTALTGFTCGPPPLNLDTGFDMWCGDELCAWECTAGDVERVPTWHRSDYGVELVGNPAEISQLTTARADCLEFRLQVDRDPNVDLTIEMDFQDDGVTEYSHPIPTTNFEPASYRITPPTWYHSVRFIVRKTGAGRAVLAQIKVLPLDRDKCSAPPMDLDDRPLGADCETDQQCQDGQCVMIDLPYNMGPRCGLCQNDDDCSGGETCGLGQIEGSTYRECVPAASRYLGELCLGNGECMSAVCCDRICSQCCQDQDCSSGTCEPRSTPVPGGAEPDYLFWPSGSQCSPGEGTASTGEVCMFDDDCRSGVCLGEGSLKKCGFCFDASETGDVESCLMDSNGCQTDQDCQTGYRCVVTGTIGGQCQ